MRHSNFLRHFLRILLKTFSEISWLFSVFFFEVFANYGVQIQKEKVNKLQALTYILVKVVLAAIEVRGLFEVSKFNTLEMR